MTVAYDPFIPITELSARLRNLTGRSPGYRRLLVLHADGVFDGVMERRSEKFLGCRESRIPELARRLDMTALPSGPVAA